MREFNLNDFALTAERIRKRAIEENRLLDNPTDDELKPLMEKEPSAKKTIYGNFSAESEPTSRSAMFTKNSVDDAFGKGEEDLLAQCEEILGRKKSPQEIF